ncbi:MAG: hypothetical protein M0P31_00475 [Solirubrobacteraceae bacterium]|nr:hypothetical protein [Solirubrobacteraceae bacterium]
MRPFIRILPVVWLLALLVAPAAAYVMGERQPDLENRPKAAAPDLNRGTLRKEETFKQLDAAIVDRLPLRQHALSLRGRIAIDVFGDSPNRDVLLGDDRWLYFREALRLCEDEGRPRADPADAVELVARTLTASGRRTGVLVAGSKLAIARENRPDVDARKLDCMERRASRVHRRLDGTPGGLTIRDRLLELEAAGRPTFLRSDTHWNATGRLTFVRAVLDRVRPGLADEVDVHLGPEEGRDGDLGRFIGRERIDHDETVVITRPPADPPPAGDVLLVGDSQMDRSLVAPVTGPSIRDRVLPGQRFCLWHELAAGACDEAMRRAKVVITEVVARNLDGFVEVCWRPVALTAPTLDGERGRWERTDDGRRGRELTLTDGSAPVRVRVPGPDVRRVPRLLRLPIRHLPAAAAGQPPSTVTLTQDATAGPAVPCATPSQSVEGGALFLPVPAGRPASSVLATLSGPAGTVLGAPEEIVLDGR